MTDTSTLHRRTVRRFVRSPRGIIALGLAALGLAALVALAQPTSSAAQTPSATPTTHTVQAGETLSQIARQHGLSVDELMRVNGIPNADAIYVGQSLRFPLAEPPAGVTVHEVQPGEALLQIARIYGVDVRAIMRANGIANPNGIVAGQELVIPEVPAPLAATHEPSTPTQAPATEGEQSGALVHKVLQGETASGIARRFGVRLADLLRANGIANADMIRIGANLVIPTAESATTAAPTTTPTPTEMPQAVEVTPTEPQPLETLAFSAAGVDVADAPADAPVVAAGGPTPVPLPELPATSLNRTYTVVRGDTVPAIALRLGVDTAALRALNALTDDVRLVAGNTLLLPATERDLRVVTAVEQYVVQRGDSLSGIASQFGVTLADLMNANRISNPNLVSVGEQLIIPGRAVDGSGPLPRVGPARTGYFFYTVQPGDTLSELAKNLDITEMALLEYNNLPNEQTVYSGMELRVPYGPPSIPQRLPPVPTSGSSFVVSLSRQQCWIFSGREVEHAFNCSTGESDHPTKKGSFAVQSKIDNAKSNVWRLDMPYWLGIYDVGKVENGIHGLPVSWATGRKIWTQLIGHPATFGCAMLGDEDAKTLYDLAYIGMPVHIIQ